MDKEIENDLIDAAQRLLKFDFNEKQKRILIDIHEEYLNHSFSLEYLKRSQKEFKKAKKASKEFIAALKEAGMFGDNLIHKLKPLLNSAFNSYEGEIIEGQKLKSGPKEKYRLRFYIFNMAQWYYQYVGKKPGTGPDGPFSRLIHNCLQVVDPDQCDEDHTKAMRIILKKTFG